MIKQELKLIITFHTTTEAMAMEQLAKANGASGRLIPTPTVITAGCGLAWCADLAQKQNLEKFMLSNDINYETMCECLI